MSRFCPLIPEAPVDACFPDELDPTVRVETDVGIPSGTKKELMQQTHMTKAIEKRPTLLPADELELPMLLSRPPPPMLRSRTKLTSDGW